MSQEQKNSSFTDWQSHCTVETFKHRARLLKQLRHFFDAKGYLEVDTPLLCQGVNTDPHIHPLQTEVLLPGQPKPQTYYLQTSPEFAMKCLLCSGIGPIYQICKAFRDQETGKYHNPEFTMIEWYQPGFNYHQLMEEISELFSILFQCDSADKISYQDLFLHYLAIDPYHSDVSQLISLAQTLSQAPELLPPLAQDDKDGWLNYLMTHHIEHQLGQDKPVFVFDYPATQASLACTREIGDYSVAERFEVYYQGIELGNGFQELTDPVEQQYRFIQDLKMRESISLPAVSIDNKLIAALEHGLPDCSGVAVGFDRLLMLYTQKNHINEVICTQTENS